MITVKSTGVDKIIERIKSIQDSCNVNSLSPITEKIAERIKDFIINRYISTGTVWQEKNGNLSTVSGDDVLVIKNADNYVITIGSRTQPFDMPDHSNDTSGLYAGLPTQVNPYFFIEFGFGIAGQDSPVKNAEKWGWRYNIHNHTQAWTFIGLDGTPTESIGVHGAGAINSLLNSEFKRIVNEVIAEERNNGGTDR